MKEEGEHQVGWTGERGDQKGEVKYRATKERLMQGLQEIMDFIKGTRGSQRNTLSNFDKPLEDLRIAVRYTPTHPTFTELPNEIKRRILNYLNIHNAVIAAAVCKDWKEILAKKCIGKAIIIQHQESITWRKDERDTRPRRIMNALATHQLNVQLRIYGDMSHLNTFTLIKAVGSVSNVKILGEGGCICWRDDICQCKFKSLTTRQLDRWLTYIQTSKKKMEKVELMDVDISSVNQDVLHKSIWENIETLCLRRVGKIRMLTQPQDISTPRLKQIVLHLVHFHIGEVRKLAEALIQIESVHLTREFPHLADTVVEIIKKINDPNPIRIKVLNTEGIIEAIPISPRQLRKGLKRLRRITLRAPLNRSQSTAIARIPKLTVTGGRIKTIRKTE